MLPGALAWWHQASAMWLGEQCEYSSRTGARLSSRSSSRVFAPDETKWSRKCKYKPSPMPTCLFACPVPRDLLAWLGSYQKSFVRPSFEGVLCLFLLYGSVAQQVLCRHAGLITDWSCLGHRSKHCHISESKQHRQLCSANGAQYSTAELY